MGGNLTKEEKKIAFGVGAVFVAGALCVAYASIKDTDKGQEQEKDSTQKNQSSKQQSQNAHPQQQQKPTQQQSLKQSQTPPNQGPSELEIAASKIKVEQTQNGLSFQTIVKILEVSLDLSANEFRALTEKNRSQRRPIRTKKPDEYAKLIMKYNLDVEELLESKQKELCHYLKIDDAYMEESMMQLMATHFQQFYMVQVSIRQKIKEKMPSKHEINLDELKKVIQYQLEIMDKESQYLQESVDKLMQFPPPDAEADMSQIAPTALNTIIADLLFEQYKVEEEDVMKTIVQPGIIAIPEIRQLLEQLEGKLFEFMSQFQQGDY